MNADEHFKEVEAHARTLDNQALDDEIILARAVVTALALEKQRRDTINEFAKMWPDPKETDKEPSFKLLKFPKPTLN